MIAAESIVRNLSEKNTTAALLFVPTIALVAQQAKALGQWLTLTFEVGEFYGD